MTFEPGVISSYDNGWKQLWPHFFELFLISLISWIINGIGEIFSLIYTVFAGFPLNFGVAYAYLKAARNEKLDIGDTFSGFRNYWNTVGAGALVALAVIAGIILLVVPGIYIACKLAFTPYLVVDRKMRATEAMEASWRMTNGHGWKVFFIGLLGIPIVIAGLICLVLGVIISIMWINMALASLYHAVSNPTSSAAPPSRG